MARPTRPKAVSVDHDRRRILSATVLTVFASLPLGLLGSSTLTLPIEGALPLFHGATGWLNSTQIESNKLRGKVVLVDFWTYTCINWRRSLPYVSAWDQKYRQDGLTVIGVHSPEFTFERDQENVRRAVKEMQIEYPIALDNNFAIWNAFNNEYWPAVYLVDAKGGIRHHQFGEGEYAQSEAVIQELLAEVGATGFTREPVSVSATGAELPADWQDLKSNENYLGYEKTRNLETRRDAGLNLNHWAFTGDWKQAQESINLKSSHGRLAYQFHARDAHLVMGPATKGTKVRFRVSIDGRIPGDAHGGDVDAQGNGIVSEPRMYQLIRQPMPIIDRRLEIEFMDPGIQAYSFTFG